MNGQGHSHSQGASPSKGHSQSQGHSHSHAGNRRLLLVVLALNAGYMVVEIIGGLVFGSLALLADAAHMGSDVAGIIIALIAQSLLSKPPSARHTFGLMRSEVLAAQANGLLLVVTGGWVLYEAVGRIGDAPEIDGGWVAVVAAVGLLVNVVSAGLLFGARHDNLNMRGVFLHMLADAAGSVAAIVAGLAALFGQLYWVDPAVSVLIGVLVLASAWGLLKAATHVLLEGSPTHVESSAVVDALLGHRQVADVHHLHLWYLASDEVALSGHVVLDGEPSLHEAQQVGDELRALLQERFAVAHATLELECHNCDNQVHVLSG